MRAGARSCLTGGEGRARLVCAAMENGDCRMNWILPERIDNHFPGHRAVVAIFAFITLITLGRSLFHMLAPDGGAQSVAHIPLSTFSRRRRGRQSFSCSRSGASLSS